MSTIEAGKNPRDIILKPVTTEKSLASWTWASTPSRLTPREQDRDQDCPGAYLQRQDRFHRDPEPQGQDLPHRNGIGKRKDVKRAIVTVREGTIDIFGDQAEDRRDI